MIVGKTFVLNVQFMVLTYIKIGKHKDHAVKMVKKAIAEVKEQYIDKISKLSTFQSSVLKAKDNFHRIIKDTNERHVREKYQISREF